MPSHKVVIKLIIIAVLVLLSLVPLKIIQFQIEEREDTRNEVVEEVGQSWGKPQQIIGPILTIPYKIVSISKKDTSVSYSKIFVLPDNINYNCVINPQVRYRSLYEVVVYTMDLGVTGNFKIPEINIKESEILWNDAYISVGIPDMRGLNHSVKCKWDTVTYDFKPSVKDNEIFNSGMHLNLENSLIVEPKDSVYNFSFYLTLNGSHDLSFAPIGKETKVDINSSWKAPSFFGSYLPTSRIINNQGFEAKWELTYFGRNYPQVWSESNNSYKNSIENSSFGVEFLYPVDIYQKTLRSVKYGILFISLTFLVFFLFEVLSKLKIHSIHYVLVGFALTVFYLLLISLSEQWNFLGAYITGSLATIFIILVYVYKFLENKKRVILLASILIALYVYLYVILQLEDYAFLFGSIGLFVILAIVMLITRKIDWYNIYSTIKENE